MPTFTAEERAALYAMFSIHDHEVREGAKNKDSGKITWFTYVRREAIQIRLDEFFFGEWELYFLDPHNPYTYHKDHVDCAMGLSIRGIRREYNGSQEGGGLNGAKGAATDAFKRVTSMWGIGLYLQSSPVIRTDGYKDANGQIDWKKKDKAEESAMMQVEQWLRKIGASGQGLSPAKSESPESSSTAQAKQEPTPKPSNPQAWENDLITLVTPLFKARDHAKNAINGLLQNKIIVKGQAINEAAAAVFQNRALKEYEADEEILNLVLGKHPKDFKQTPEAFKAAWEMLAKASKQANDSE